MRGCSLIAEFLEGPYNNNILDGPNCKQSSVHVLDVDHKTFTAMTAPLRDWWATVSLGPRAVVFVAAGLLVCGKSLHGPHYDRALRVEILSNGVLEQFVVPIEVTVTLYLSPAVAPYSAFGTTVTAATMTEIYALGLRKLSGRVYGGTSAANPHAAGIYAQFLLARIWDNPDYLDTTEPESALQEFLDVAIDNGRPTPGMGDGSVFLDAASATVIP